MDRKESKKIFAISVAILAALAIGIFLMATGTARAQSVGVGLPSIPTGLSTATVPPSTITVSWSASTESSGTIAGYYVYRNGVQIATTNITSFSDIGLTPGVYVYTIAAFDASGNVSPLSSPASASIVLDTTPPSVPTGVAVSGATTTNTAYTEIPVTISWNASTDNVGVAGYKVYRNGTLLTTSTAPYTSTSYGDTVTPGTYWYTVVAYDASGNISNQSAQAIFTINVDTNPPSVPTNLSAEQVSGSGVNLSWTPSTDSVGIAGYQVFRNGTQVASAGGPPYADTGLSAGNTYTYTVSAYDVAGNVSFQTSPITITLQAANGPAVPYGLSATAIGTSSVRFSWAAVGDALALTGYTVYRNGSQIASVVPTSTSYVDIGLASGTYYYGVSATDVSGAVSAITTSTNVTVPAVGAFAAVPIGPAILAPVIAPLATPAIAASTTSAASTPVFTQFLYFGLRSAQVGSLQSLLAENGYLAPADATGYFGSLTLHAVEQFQCDQNVVCTGGAGWGTVGPKTRAALNGLGSAAVPSTTSVSTSSLAAEIQALEAELAALESQVH